MTHSLQHILKAKQLHQQKGAFVLNAILAIVLISIVMIMIYRHEAWQDHQDHAKTLGNQLSMLTNAIENKMAFDENFKMGRYQGAQLINALKSSQCGGDAKRSYLPCAFELNQTLFANPISLEVAVDPTDNNDRQGTLTVGPIGLLFNGKFKASAMLAGSAIREAEAYSPAISNKFLDATTSYQLDQKTAVITANLEANQTNGDTFLLIDGKNDMNNNLKFNSQNPANDRDLENVSNIDLSSKNGASINSTDNLSIQSGSQLNIDTSGSATVYLGNQSGNTSQSNVEVNNMRILSLGNHRLSTLLKMGQYNCYRQQAYHSQHPYMMPTCREGYYVAGVWAPGSWRAIILCCALTPNG